MVRPVLVVVLRPVLEPVPAVVLDLAPVVPGPEPVVLLRPVLVLVVLLRPALVLVALRRVLVLVVVLRPVLEPVPAVVLDWAPVVLGPEPVVLLRPELAAAGRVEELEGPHRSQ